MNDLVLDQMTDLEEVRARCLAQEHEIERLREVIQNVATVAADSNLPAGFNVIAKVCEKALAL